MPVWRERPSVEDAGVVGWFRGLLETRPIRPDRSRSPRLGSVAAAWTGWTCGYWSSSSSRRMGMRTFRLAEPYQMHFDEVYHARTATEFLQAWRYGLSHDIYEWTHPAPRQVRDGRRPGLWGQDHVSATSELGHARHATVVEPRRDDT